MIRAVSLLFALACPLGAAAQGINFGDDSGAFARDGVCDDRRFVGSAMAGTLDWESAGRDATDCRAAFDRGALRLFDLTASLAATQCAAIDYGDDSGEFPNDGECDDPRFEGMAVDGYLLEEDAYADATDCRRACEMGLLGLRDYAPLKPSQRKGFKN